MKSLEGKTILLTRSAEDNDAWEQVIRSRGGDVKALPCIACEFINDAGTAASLKDAIAHSHWLALTSRRGVRAVLELCPEPLPGSIRVAVVGESTATEAWSLLRRCNLVSDEPTGQGLAQSLAATLTKEGIFEGMTVVIAAAESGLRHLEAVLEPLGVKVDRIAVYRTLPSPQLETKHDLSEWGIDTILLASPSAARGLINQATVPAGVDVITIGPSTTKAARSLDIAVTAQADRPELESILEVLS